MQLNAEVAEHEFTGKQILTMAMQVAQQAFESGGKLPGITTGLDELDEILGGWHDSDLTLVGARPAMGKTAFLLGLAEAAAATGIPVGVISAEQPAVQLGIRRAALASGVGAMSIRAGQISLAEAYVQTDGSNAWLVNAHVAPYEQANRFNHDPKRPRRLRRWAPRLRF